MLSPESIRETSERRVKMLAFVNKPVFMGLLVVIGLLLATPGAHGAGTQPASEDDAEAAPAPAPGPEVTGAPEPADGDDDAGDDAETGGSDEEGDDAEDRSTTGACDDDGATDGQTDHHSAAMPLPADEPHPDPEPPVPAETPHAAPHTHDADDERPARQQHTDEDDCDADASLPAEIPIPPGLPLDDGTLLGAMDTRSPGTGDVTGPQEPSPADAAVARAQVAPSDDAAVAEEWLVAAALGLGAMVLLALWRTWGFVATGLSRFALALGYRIDRAQLLEHPVRKELVASLTTRPGATMGDLVEACGVSYGRVGYHLRMLVREQVLRVRDVDGTKRYFPYTGPVVDEAEVRLQALAHGRKVSGRMLAFLSRTPGLSLSDIARALGVSPGHAHYHMSRLRDHGLVRAVRQGRRSRHYVTDRGVELIVPSA